MIKNILLGFTTMALMVASAATYHVTFFQPSVVKGTELKAGDYRLNLQGDKVTIVSGKNAVEVPVKVEQGDQKFNTTTVRYATANGKDAIAEIRLGGTKTKLVFNQ
jgi:hypothetical protein